jgi:hypothetical protein
MANTFKNVLHFREIQRILQKNNYNEYTQTCSTTLLFHKIQYYY